VGPTVKDGPCLGCGCTTSGSTTDDGRVRGAGCGELEAAVFCNFWSTDESIEVGGGSCGGDIWGVIKAGSLGRFLWWSIPLIGLSSREDVPAGVNGGDCITDAAADTRCWEDWPDGVREVGEGEGACLRSIACSTSLVKRFAHSGRRQGDRFEREVLHALGLATRVLQR
jgi:hypothetical protein